MSDGEAAVREPIAGVQSDLDAENLGGWRFGRVVVAAGASVLGDRLLLALMAIYVTGVAGVEQVGLVLAAQTVPFLVLVPAGGVWADRLSRAELARVCDLIRAATFAAVAVLTAAGAVGIAELAGAMAVLGACDAFSLPAFAGLVPELVLAPSQLRSGRAWMQAAEHTADVLGPAMASASLWLVGAPAGIAAASGMFAASALLLTGLRSRVRATGSSGPDRGRWVDDFRRGVAAVSSRRWLWISLMSMASGILLCQAPLFVLGPEVCRQVYGSATVFGAILTALAVGGVLGAGLALRLAPRFPLRAGFALCAAWPVVAWAPALHAPLPVVLVAALVSGTVLALFAVYWTTTMAEQIPAELLSRVTSVYWFAALLPLPIGMLAAPAVAEAISPRAALLVGGALTTILLLCALLEPAVRTLEAGPASVRAQRR
ncbi:hypothetical protein AYO39_01400 [Actinobacteria bacterium SCGC AG-212-D09]|nr:hypothetical protein AYO39_01400 [Actinobacteria bacterium SCGC AG-212-D09]